MYISAAFVAGILLDALFRPPPWAAICIAITIFAVTIIPVKLGRSGLATALLLATFCAAGGLASSVQRHAMHPDRLAKLYDNQQIVPDDAIELTGVLARPPEPIRDGCLIDIEAKQVVSRQQQLAASGKVRLMLSLQDEQVRDEYQNLGLDYGSEARILVRLARAQTYGNPGSVDFDEFLERRGYDLKGTIKSPLLIETAGRARTNPFLAALYHLRLRVMQALDARFPAAVSGTLKAMLVGNRYFLDPTTVQRLREGGTFHTLVIAGLHVGIIAWLLLGIGPGTRRPHPVRIALALAVLWSYAVMVGMSPPVTRATTMITIGLIGPMIFRRSVSLNSVAIAGFLMLATDPSLVWDAGFQLSFAAVFGIVALALPICDRLGQIGRWRPSAQTPHPPRCSA
ncbi:MAG TPA: ComEC/Rec2 family competence protein [Blastocatellia bacterium]